jgi:hypothetical protein
MLVGHGGDASRQFGGRQVAFIAAAGPLLGQQDKPEQRCQNRATPKPGGPAGQARASFEAA